MPVQIWRVAHLFVGESPFTRDFFISVDWMCRREWGLANFHSDFLNLNGIFSVFKGCCRMLGGSPIIQRMPPETLSDPTAGELKRHWG